MNKEPVLLWVWAVSSKWKAGRTTRGMRGLTLHDFRRSAIRNLVTLAGVREKVAMEITGGKTRSVFDRYHIVDTQDVSNAMQRW